MYHVEDTISAIKELQRLLYLNQTGFFDQETKEAVIDIQNSYGLKNTGVADYETFSAILKEFHRKQNAYYDSDFLFAPQFPYQVGDFDENIKLINDALIPILKDYVYEGPIPRGKYFGNDTLNAIHFLQEIFGDRKNDKITAEFVNRLLDEKRVLKIKMQHSK